MNRLKRVARKELLIIMTAIAMGIAFTAAFTKAYSETTVEKLAEKFIRLHVVANSDSEADQQLKLNVRDTVMERLQAITENASNINEAREIIISSLDEINEVAKSAVIERGYNYDVSSELRTTNFPTKFYGDFALVAGQYEALSIKIGNAKGQNWWCVVYPPLCFVDVATGAKENKERLKKELTEEEYKLVAENDKAGVKIKFKAVELWQERKLAKETKRTVAKSAR